MATRTEIHCINKADRQAADERIKNIGGLNQDGTRWLLTLDNAIKGIEDGRWEFFVQSPRGGSVNVIISKSARGRKYLKTTADGDMPNNLLSLPECP